MMNIGFVLGAFWPFLLTVLFFSCYYYLIPSLLEKLWERCSYYISVRPRIFIRFYFHFYLATTPHLKTVHRVHSDASVVPLIIHHLTKLVSYFTAFLLESF